MDPVFPLSEISDNGTNIMRSLKINVVLFLLVTVLSLFFISRAETRVHGIISSNERWTAEKSPYIINGDILVTKKAKLVISPGTRILISQPLYYDSTIQQIDHLDSQTVSIKINGMLNCVGRKNNRIKISPLYKNKKKCSWYGIVFDDSFNELTEIAFTDIAGAFHGLISVNSSPLIRNTVLEYNNVGISCREKGNIRVYNSVIAYNFTCGVKVFGANPLFNNNIIAFNRNNGVWGDNASSMTFNYNCVFGNPDGDFLDCNPKLGILKKVNKNKDSIDFADNLHQDPIFKGSQSDSAAAENDISSLSGKSKSASSSQEKKDTLSVPSVKNEHIGSISRYLLSKYSPCINAGNPNKLFKDDDGSRNDMGIYGGKEFVELNKN